MQQGTDFDVQLNYVPYRLRNLSNSKIKKIQLFSEERKYSLNKEQNGNVQNVWRNQWSVKSTPPVDHSCYFPPFKNNHEVDMNEHQKLQEHYREQNQNLNRIDDNSKNQQVIIQSKPSGEVTPENSEKNQMNVNEFEYFHEIQKIEETAPIQYLQSNFISPRDPFDNAHVQNKVQVSHSQKQQTLLKQKQAVEDSSIINSLNAFDKAEMEAMKELLIEDLKQFPQKQNEKNQEEAEHKIDLLIEEMKQSLRNLQNEVDNEQQIEAQTHSQDQQMHQYQSNKQSSVHQQQINNNYQSNKSSSVQSVHQKQNNEEDKSKKQSQMHQSIQLQQLYNEIQLQFNQQFGNLQEENIEYDHIQNVHPQNRNLPQLADEQNLLDNNLEQPITNSIVEREQQIINDIIEADQDHINQFLTDYQAIKQQETKLNSPPIQTMEIVNIIISPPIKLDQDNININQANHRSQQSSIDFNSGQNRNQLIRQDEQLVKYQANQISKQSPLNYNDEKMNESIKQDEKSIKYQQNQMLQQWPIDVNDDQNRNEQIQQDQKSIKYKANQILQSQLPLNFNRDQNMNQLIKYDRKVVNYNASQILQQSPIILNGNINQEIKESNKLAKQAQQHHNKTATKQQKQDKKRVNFKQIYKNANATKKPNIKLDEQKNQKDNQTTNTKNQLNQKNIIGQIKTDKNGKINPISPRHQKTKKQISYAHPKFEKAKVQNKQIPSIGEKTKKQVKEHSQHEKPTVQVHQIALNSQTPKKQMSYKQIKQQKQKKEVNSITPNLKKIKKQIVEAHVKQEKQKINSVPFKPKKAKKQMIEINPKQKIIKKQQINSMALNSEQSKKQQISEVWHQQDKQQAQRVSLNQPIIEINQTKSDAAKLQINDISPEQAPIIEQTHSVIIDKPQFQQNNLQQISNAIDQYEQQIMDHHKPTDSCFESQKQQLQKYLQENQQVIQNYNDNLIQQSSMIIQKQMRKNDESIEQEIEPSVNQNNNNFTFKQPQLINPFLQNQIQIDKEDNLPSSSIAQENPPQSPGQVLNYAKGQTQSLLKLMGSQNLKQLSSLVIEDKHQKQSQFIQQQQFKQQLCEIINARDFISREQHFSLTEPEMMSLSSSSVHFNLNNSSEFNLQAALQDSPPQAYNGDQEALRMLQSDYRYISTNLNEEDLVGMERQPYQTIKIEEEDIPKPDSSQNSILNTKNKQSRHSQQNQDSMRYRNHFHPRQYAFYKLKQAQNSSSDQQKRDNTPKINKSAVVKKNRPIIEIRGERRKNMFEKNLTRFKTRMN